MAASFWLLLAPLLTGAFVGLVVAFLLEEDNPWRWIGLLAGAVAALLLRLRLAAAGARARILSGNSPFGCFRAPRTPEQFADQLCETWMATGRRPAVVGSGWGWFIGRAHARDAVYTHKLKGRIGEFTFLAGTELRSVEVALRKAHGRTFWSTPTMQRISIGSWLARSCHGNSGAAGKPSWYAASRVLVVDLTSLAHPEQEGARWIEYAQAKRDFDRYPGQFVIAAVEFDLERMSEDIWLQKGRTDVGYDRYTATLALREWLTAEAVLRVLFFGSARKIGVGVTYVPFDPDEDAVDYRRECGCCGRMIPHVDPHDCSAACMCMQLDTCSLVCGWYETAKRSWRGIIKLSDANAFSPDPSWLGFPIDLAAERHGQLRAHLRAAAARGAHAALAGAARAEAVQRAAHSSTSRCGAAPSCAWAAWTRGSCSSTASRASATRPVIAALKPHVHLQTVALHDGKFQGRQRDSRHPGGRARAQDPARGV